MNNFNRPAALLLTVFTAGCAGLQICGSDPPPPPPPPPPVVAPAPAPAPLPLVVLTPAPKKVSFAASSLFDFDRATLKAEGKLTLDALAEELRSTDYDTITVTGYTDRLGAQAYNLELSLRRAEAVKVYLMESADIASEKIQTRGADGEAPVTQRGECKGKVATPALIACLQPDRRVEVEVNGER